jgi:hypothetical protein
MDPEDPIVVAGREAVEDWGPLTEAQKADLAVIFTGALIEADAA